MKSMHFIRFCWFTVQMCFLSAMMVNESHTRTLYISNEEKTGGSSFTFMAQPVLGLVYFAYNYRISWTTKRI